MLARRLGRWCARTGGGRRNAKSKPCEKRIAVWSASQCGDAAEVVGGAEGKNGSFHGGMACAGEKRRTEGREITARVAEDQTQDCYQQRLVDCGTRGGKGLGGHTGGLFEGRRSVRRGAVRGSKRKAAADFWRTADARQIAGR